MIGLSVKAGDGESNYFGVPAKDLQSGVVISGLKVSGTLHKQEKFEAFNPSDPSEQTGYYLVLKLDGDPDATIKTQMTGGSSKGKEVTVDDGFCIYLIKEPSEQKIVVKIENGEDSVERTYDLSGLVLDEED